MRREGREHGRLMCPCSHGPCSHVQTGRRSDMTSTTVCLPIYDDKSAVSPSIAKRIKYCVSCAPFIFYYPPASHICVSALTDSVFKMSPTALALNRLKYLNTPYAVNLFLSIIHDASAMVF